MQPGNPSSNDAEAVGQHVPQLRRLPMSDELFTEGNLRREELAKQTLAGAPGQPPLPGEDAILSEDECEVFECHCCHLRLLTGHLLDMHLLEIHDSFFAAQAARRMKVYRCLVERCTRQFCTPAERRAHLIDHHCYSPAFRFDTLHLGGGRSLIKADGSPRQQRISSPDERQQQRSMQPEATPLADSSPGAATLIRQDEDPEAAGSSVDMDVDSITQGVSRLSMAGQDTSSMPGSISFGRRGRGVLGRRGRGRRGALA